MKLIPWHTEVEKAMINLFLDDTEMYVPRFSVTVSNKEPLDTKCFYFGWRIPSFPNLDIQSNSVRQILTFWKLSVFVVVYHVIGVKTQSYMQFQKDQS